MKLDAVLRRFALPGVVVSLYYLLRYRCYISPRAEVEIAPDLRIGPGVRISSYTKVKSGGGQLTIGAHTSITTGCSLSTGARGVEIGEHCLIGPNAVILGSNYQYGDVAKRFDEQEMVSKGVRIGDNVWVGAGAIVLDGSTLGSGVIVTPNSVVSGKIPANTIVQGNPGKVVFERR
jgi:acetyltransferase-like isoleucine patch superfamily enzyme